MMTIHTTYTTPSPLPPGYTRKLYGGHLSVPTTAPKVGYHGEEGYRRNTPDLRDKRSVFDYEGNQKRALCAESAYICTDSVHCASM